MFAQNIYKDLFIDFHEAVCHLFHHFNIKSYSNFSRHIIALLLVLDEQLSVNGEKHELRTGYLQF